MNKPIKAPSSRDMGWACLFTEVAAVQQPLAPTHSRMQTAGVQAGGLQTEPRRFWKRKRSVGIRGAWDLGRQSEDVASKTTATCEMKGHSNVVGQYPEMLPK